MYYEDIYKMIRTVRKDKDIPEVIKAGVMYNKTVSGKKTMQADFRTCRRRSSNTRTD
jgi:hypothetical protein